MTGRWGRFKLGKTPPDVDRAVRCTVMNAYNNVPHYRAAWDAANLRPKEVRGAGDLGRLPVTARHAISNVPQEDRLHRRVNRERCVSSSTSGYLGIPLTVHMSRAEALWRKLTLLQAMGRYARVRPPLRQAEVGSMVPRHGKSIEERMGIVRIARLPATLSPADMAARLTTFHPGVVKGYPTCLASLAEYLAAHPSLEVRPHVVISGGEVLHEATREVLSRVFGCPVVDLYSCEEGGNLAWECPQNPGLWHVNQDTCVLEVVDERNEPVPPGTEGKVLLTSLFNWTMPFIRYELGDRAIRGPAERCVCGIEGTTLASIAGRDDDFLVGPDGRRLSPRLVANTVFNALRDVTDPAVVTSDVRQFQVVQESLTELCLRVVLETSHGRRTADGAARALEGLIPGSTCRVEEVGEIVQGPGGKLRKVLASRQP